MSRDDTSLPAQNPTISPRAFTTSVSSGSGTFQRLSRRMRMGIPSSGDSPAGRLEEQLRPLGVVHLRIHVLDGRFRFARFAAAQVGDAGGPHFAGRLDRRERRAAGDGLAGVAREKAGQLRRAADCEQAVRAGSLPPADGRRPPSAGRAAVWCFRQVWHANPQGRRCPRGLEVGDALVAPRCRHRRTAGAASPARPGSAPRRSCRCSVIHRSSSPLASSTPRPYDEHQLVPERAAGLHAVVPRQAMKP